MTTTNPTRTQIVSAAAGLAAYARAFETIAQTVPLVASGVPSGNDAVDALLSLTYVFPTTRLVARGFRPILPDDLRNKLDADSTTSLGRFNEWTGKMDGMMSPYRALLLPILAYFYGSHPTAMAVAAFIGSSLAALDHSNRIEKDLVINQMKAGCMITAEAWERHENRAQGILGSNIPEKFSPTELLVNNPARYGDGVRREASTQPFYAGLLNIGSAIFGLARRTSVHAEGFTNTVKNYFGVTFLGARAKPTRKFTEAIGYALGHWAQKQAQAYKMNIDSHGFDKLAQIPQGTPIVHAIYGHTMWTNYVLFALRPNIRFMAAIGKFRNNLVAKISSFAWLMDMLALPPAIKNTDTKNASKYSQAAVIKDVTDNIQDLGIEPAIFVQGGRGPRSYHDDGTLDISTMYDNVTKLSDPERYDNMYSVIKIAKAAAVRAGMPTFISTIDILGGAWIDPKYSDKFPFVQPIIQGGTIDFRYAGGFYVTPETLEQEIIDQIHTMIRDFTGVDAYLAQLASQWASQLDDPIDQEVIAQTIAKDERYAIIIARIRAIPPQKANEQRTHMKKCLLDLIHQELSGNKNNVLIQEILLEVAGLVHTYEYDQSIPLQVREVA